MERQPLSKRIRFEVFKRDKFACQYCGRKAPDVVLQADHIVAVANGGTDTLLNLVTSCDSCNSGKSSVPLNDESAVEKQRKQAELLQEKLEQVRMMADWQHGLIDVEDREVSEIEHMFHRFFKCGLTDMGRKNVRKLIHTYGFHDVLTATTKACQAQDKPQGVLRAVEKHLKYTKMCTTNPEQARYAYVGGTLRNKFPKQWDVVEYKYIVKAWKREECDADELYEIAKSANNWNEFCDLAEDHLAKASA